MQVILTKISENKNDLRTNEVIGFAPFPPAIDRPFIVWAESLENNHPEATREVITSVVQEVLYNEEHQTYTIKTLNSTYTVKILYV
jgi:hypothetical protein